MHSSTPAPPPPPPTTLFSTTTALPFPKSATPLASYETLLSKNFRLVKYWTRQQWNDSPEGKTTKLGAAVAKGGRNSRTDGNNTTMAYVETEHGDPVDSERASEIAEVF